jgi:hypothetical protein
MRRLLLLVLSIMVIAVAPAFAAESGSSQKCLSISDVNQQAVEIGPT